MKVAILGSRGIPARYGGFEIFADKLAEGLVRKGWDVTVYCPSSQSYKETVYNGVYLNFMWHPSGRLGPLIYDALCIISAARSDNDLVIMLGYGSSPLLPILRVVRKPIIVNTDGLEWKRSKWPWYARFYFRFAEWVVTRVADQLVSDSIAIQRYYLDTHGRESQYIAYGSDLPSYSEANLGNYFVEPKSYYLVVMRLEPENCILEIVRGYIKSERKYPLLIVGQTTPYFESEVLPLLSDRSDIRFVGTIYDRKELYSLRQNALVYIHGHKVGGTNPSLLEAMASGNFVIASDVEFNREVLGDQGRYFRSEEDLAQTLKLIESMDRSVIERAGEACRNIIENRYQWEEVVNDYHELLCDVACGRQKEHS